jgi:predicted component of type VI protein secretion system
MKLMLKATSNIKGEIDTIVLNQESATIGRNDSNTLVLEDPKRYISGQHAIINYYNSVYSRTDTSTAYSVFIMTFNIQGSEAKLELCANSAVNPFQLSDLQLFRCPQSL